MRLGSGAREERSDIEQLAQADEGSETPPGADEMPPLTPSASCGRRSGPSQGLSRTIAPFDAAASGDASLASGDALLVSNADALSARCSAGPCPAAWPPEGRTPASSSPAEWWTDGGARGRFQRVYRAARIGPT